MGIENGADRLHGGDEAAGYLAIGILEPAGLGERVIEVAGQSRAVLPEAEQLVLKA